MFVIPLRYLAALPILLGSLPAAADISSLGATSRTASKAPAVRAPLVRRGPFCSQLYDQLTAFQVNSELSFLPESLRADLRRISTILQEDLRRFHAPTPFLTFTPS